MYGGIPCLWRRARDRRPGNCDHHDAKHARQHMGHEVATKQQSVVRPHNSWTSRCAGKPERSEGNQAPSRPCTLCSDCPRRYRWYWCHWRRHDGPHSADCRCMLRNSPLRVSTEAVERLLGVHGRADVPREGWLINTFRYQASVRNWVCVWGDQQLVWGPPKRRQFCVAPLALQALTKNR